MVYHLGGFICSVGALMLDTLSLNCDARDMFKVQHIDIDPNSLLSSLYFVY